MARFIFSILFLLSTVSFSGNPDTLCINNSQLFNQHYFWVIPGNGYFAEYPFSIDGEFYSDTVRITEPTNLIIKKYNGCRYLFQVTDSSFIYENNNNLIKLKKKGYTIRRQQLYPNAKFGSDKFPMNY